MRIIRITIPEKDQDFWFQVFNEEWELHDLVQGIQSAVREYYGDQETQYACDWEGARAIPENICKKHGFLPFKGQPRTYVVSGQPITPETAWRVEGVHWFDWKGLPIEYLPKNIDVPGYVHKDYILRWLEDNYRKDGVAFVGWFDTYYLIERRKI